MLIRILAIVFLFSACSGTSTTADASEKKEMKFIFKSQADASQHVEKILAETSYPLTDEEKSAIDNLAASYTVESLNDGKKARSELRKKIYAILRPEQVNVWKERQLEKKKKEEEKAKSVIIQ